MKFFLTKVLLTVCAVAFGCFARAAEYRYDWFGGAAGYEGYVILDAPTSAGLGGASGTSANIVSGRVSTPQGVFEFNRNQIYASRPVFTWDETQITYMFFAWGPGGLPPAAAFGANYDYNFNGIPHTYLVSVAVNGNQFLDESGLWIATNSQIVPQFKTHPAAQTAVAGGPVTFTSRAIAKPNPTYQWRRNGVDIPGATSSTYTISSTAPGDAGTYTVVATNSVGSTTSNSAGLTIAVAAPTITSQPVDTAVVPGQTATFAVTATGVPTQGFSWQRQPAGTTAWLELANGGSYSGVNTNTLTITGTTTTMSGDRFRCSAINLYGSATSNAVTLSVVTFTSAVSAVSSGYYHTMFIKTNGTLWGTGANNQGELGDGTWEDRYTPVQIAANVASVSAGYAFTLFVKADGTLWATGNNDYGQLGDGTTTRRNIPVLVATGVASASAGSSHALFVKTDGTLWAMGDNDYGQLGDGTTTQRQTPVQVASGVASVRTAGVHTLFIKTDGSLWAMGLNGNGQLGDGTTTQRLLPVVVAAGVVSISVGSQHSLFVKTDGTLWAMGDNYVGQLGDGTTTTRSSPVQVAAGVASAAAGDSHSLLVKTDGSLWAVGANLWGQLGDGSSSTRFNPVRVAGQVVSASASNDYSMFVLSNQTLWTMGRNTGWMNNGVPSLSKSPVQVSPVAIGQPLIVLEPSNETLNPGAALTFTVMATGAPAPTYQWYKNNNPISGATGSSYAIGSVAVGDVGSYTVVANNSVGSATSKAAVLTINTAPVFTAHPSHKTVIAGKLASFTTVVYASPAPTYQWQVFASGVWTDINHSSVYGTQTAALTIASSAVPAFDGSQFRCVVTNSLGSATSNAATLTLTPFSVPGDIDGDGMSEAVWRNTSGLIATWTTSGGYRNLGTEDANWKVIGSGDFDGDGLTDMLWRYGPAGLVASWTSSSGYIALGTEDANWKIIATGDFDADGQSDVLWRYVPTGRVASWASTAGYLNLGTEDANWKAISTGDFDGDGYSDVLWRYTPSGLIATWTTAGTYVSIGTEDANWSFVGTGDYDGDGTTDVLWRYAPTGAIGSWTSSAGYRSMGTEGSGWTAVGN